MARSDLVEWWQAQAVVDAHHPDGPMGLCESFGEADRRNPEHGVVEELEEPVTGRVRGAPVRALKLPKARLAQLSAEIGLLTGEDLWTFGNHDGHFVAGGRNEERHVAT